MEDERPLPVQVGRPLCELDAPSLRVPIRVKNLRGRAQFGACIPQHQVEGQLIPSATDKCQAEHYKLQECHIRVFIGSACRRRMAARVQGAEVAAAAKRVDHHHAP